jgi:hypothetical protein
MFGTSCQGFCIHITKIRVSHIYKNTISDEHTVSVQSNMHFLPTKRRVVVLHRLEEQFPEWRGIMLSNVCLCADRRIMSSYSEDLYGRKNKMFSRNH